jgi:hypothetical protein
MSPVKKIPPRSFHFLIWLLVFASALGITTSCGRSSKPDSKTVVTSEVQNLLNEGDSYTADGYFKATSSTLVAAAAGTTTRSSITLANCWSRTASAVPLSTSVAR